MAAAYDIPVVPHGSGPYSFQAIMSFPNSDFCEYIVRLTLPCNLHCPSLIVFPHRLTLRTENPSNPLLVTYSSTKSSPIMAVSTLRTNPDLGSNSTLRPSLCPIRVSSHHPRVWGLLAKLRMMGRRRLMVHIKWLGEQGEVL